MRLYIVQDLSKAVNEFAFRYTFPFYNISFILNIDNILCEEMSKYVSQIMFFIMIEI